MHAAASEHDSLEHLMGQSVMSSMESTFFKSHASSVSSSSSSSFASSGGGIGVIKACEAFDFPGVLVEVLAVAPKLGILGFFFREHCFAMMSRWSCVMLDKGSSLEGGNPPKSAAWKRSGVSVFEA